MGSVLDWLGNHWETVVLPIVGWVGSKLHTRQKGKKAYREGDFTKAAGGSPVKVVKP